MCGGWRRSSDFSNEIVESPNRDRIGRTIGSVRANQRFRDLTRWQVDNLDDGR